MKKIRRSPFTTSVTTTALAAAGLAVGRWDWWLAVGAAALAALFGNLGFLGMVMDGLHRAELQARQAQITQEISEIVGGVDALAGSAGRD